MSTNAVLVFHADARRYYEERWLARFVTSIREQTVQDFDILELDYGESSEGPLFSEASFVHMPMANHAEAQNFLLDRAFGPYEFAFNTNVDDFYSVHRIEVQLQQLQAGFDLVSCDFYAVDENDQTLNQSSFAHLSVIEELERDHNILCHPVIAYSRNFWQGCSQYRGEEIKYEDLRLWQREMHRCRYIVVPDLLCYHRFHCRSVSEMPREHRVVGHSNTEVSAVPSSVS